MRKTFCLFLVVMGIVAVGCVVDSGPGPGYGGDSGNGPGPGADECNPVTNAGCASDGSTCDLAPSGYFACFPPPNPAGICGSCDSNAGPFCGPDLSCVALGPGPGACYRYCCTDADCGAGSVCDTLFGARYLSPSDPADEVGFCVTSTSSESPACGVPAAPSSGGSCVGGYSGATSPSDSGIGNAEAAASTGDGGATPEGGFGEGGRGGRGGDGG